MTGFEIGGFESEDDFDRPFLNAPGAALVADPTPVHPNDDELPRAYLLTGGRTGGGKADVKIETIVCRASGAPSTHRSTHPRQTLTPEQREIVDTCTAALAVAEIAAALALPIGVVQVLVGDLVHDGWLQASETPTADLHSDIDFIERLISRVAAL